MASVSSLDNDLRGVRLSKYTPQAANEVREWIEEVLEENLPSGDLLEALKDGIALCKLVNAAVPSARVRYKVSDMPFVRMENISHFLRAIQAPPLGLPDHDVFLTVDLYEAKDPAQVLQCVAAFSRRANAIQPSKFKRTLGPRSRGGALSPQGTGAGNGRPAPQLPTRGRGASITSQAGVFSSTATSRYGAEASPGMSLENSQTTTPGASLTPRGGISSWSSKADEESTTPAWNIHQYGYMGGANQGNQGVSFGARRQITHDSPKVPSMAEKERKRREEEAEMERLRLEKQEAERRAQLDREAEEERERVAEQARWKEEKRKRREREKLEVEEEKKRWEAEEKRWKEEEGSRQKSAKEVDTRSQEERPKPRVGGENGLNGQYLSQYLAEQGKGTKAGVNDEGKVSSESQRVRELERELELAKERERQYQAERRSRMAREHGDDPPQGNGAQGTDHKPSLDSPPSSSTQIEQQGSPRTESDGSRNDTERQYLQNEWNKHQGTPSSFIQPTQGVTRPLPNPKPVQIKANDAGPSSRPLPDPKTYNMSRTDRFLASNPAPAPEKPKTYFPKELGFDTNAEHYTERIRREQSQNTTKAGGWASKSLLEREMEQERQRQREWEEEQKAAKGSGHGVKESPIGDEDSYGWRSGDNQHNGGVSFGARRQIIGPRPLP